jgi:hypothetical protein
MQEELNILTDDLVERAQTELSLALRPRHDTLHFPEQQISVIIAKKKVTSRLAFHISNMIHGPSLCTSMMQKEGWSTHAYTSITLDSFATTFNKLTSSL